LLKENVATDSQIKIEIKKRATDSQIIFLRAFLISESVALFFIYSFLS